MDTKLLMSNMPRDMFIDVVMKRSSTPVGYYVVGTKKLSGGGYKITQVSSSNYDPDFEYGSRRVLYHKSRNTGGGYTLLKIMSNGNAVRLANWM